MANLSHGLAAEFFRTCRHEFFFGKQFVALYDAMRAKQAARDASVALSKNAARATATDAESLYSFRPNHPDTFYVSAWEFPQWFKALQLKCPSHNYPYSKWTPAGRKKRAANDSEAMVAGEDYVFDFQKIGRMTGVYAYPEGKYVFDGAVPTNYTSFQKSWILLRRLRPMVPCPENTPLPSRRISKDARAKLFSIYLRPWTLSKKMATAEVPFLLDLAQTPTGTAQDDATPTGTAQDLAQTPTGTAQDHATPTGTAQDDATAPSNVHFRTNWKQHLRKILPHAERGVRNFMLTCLAEGRAADDDEENNRAKGPAVVCNLSLADVRSAVTLSDTRISANEDSYVSKLVLETARRAVDLTKLGAPTKASNLMPQGAIWGRQVEVPIPTKKQEEGVQNTDPSTAARRSLSEWVERYQRWTQQVYEDKNTPTPTREQRHVLLTVHFRIVKEEYELAGEPIPEAIWSSKPPDINVERPLLRLTHGLPGSGKSKLIEWLKQYFELVWQWIRNKQYALLAPMNTMADNIGGSTVHSFGHIPFKDRRGVLIQTGKGTGSSGSFFTDEEWHELRILLFDEVEAAGVSLFGRLEENVRLKVPATNTAYEGLRREQHPDRQRAETFAGVNVICFGDFWQLDPTGDTAFMTNPTKSTGDPYVDCTLSMFWHKGGEKDGHNYHLQPWQDGRRVWELS